MGAPSPARANAGALPTPARAVVGGRYANTGARPQCVRDQRASQRPWTLRGGGRSPLLTYTRPPFCVLLHGTHATAFACALTRPSNRHHDAYRANLTPRRPCAGRDPFFDLPDGTSNCTHVFAKQSIKSFIPT